MRDTASAAAMSDPDRNRWFRRRWDEPACLVHVASEAGPPLPQDELASTGLALLHEWRQQRHTLAGVR